MFPENGGYQPIRNVRSRHGLRPPAPLLWSTEGGTKPTPRGGWYTASYMKGSAETPPYLPRIQEQAGGVYPSRQQAADVAPEVDDDARHPLRLEPVHRGLHVSGRVGAERFYPHYLRGGGQTLTFQVFITRGLSFHVLRARFLRGVEPDVTNDIPTFDRQVCDRIRYSSTHTLSHTHTRVP